MVSKEYWDRWLAWKPTYEEALVILGWKNVRVVRKADRVKSLLMEMYQGISEAEKRRRVERERREGPPPPPPPPPPPREGKQEIYTLS